MFYKGVNVLILLVRSYQLGYVSPSWMTYRQCLALGGHVKKHEKGTKIVFFERVKKKEKDANGDDLFYPLLKTYTVFNRQQTDGLYSEVEKADVTNYDVKSILSSHDIMLVHGDSKPKFVYGNNIDSIRIPYPSSFDSQEAYLATLLHEAVHWTGAPPRLDRDMEDVIHEELVAELGSIFICSILGITPNFHDDHIPYIKGWVSRIEDKPKMLFEAASNAQKAVEYLIPSLKTDDQTFDG